MGLDIVELVMEVEDTFGVVLESDYSSSSMETVGGFHTVIGSHHVQKMSGTPRRHRVRSAVNAGV